ncbi:MAG: hypothetical protein U0269_13670 [Polyangiales bacterium]
MGSLLSRHAAHRAAAFSQPHSAAPDALPTIEDSTDASADRESAARSPRSTRPKRKQRSTQEQP